MIKPWTIEEINEYLENFSPTSKLVSKEYKNNSTLLTFVCGMCGETFDRRWADIKASNYKVCKKCNRKIASDNQRFTIQDVKKICEEHGFKLLQEEYNSNKDKLKIEDKDGYIGASILSNIYKGKHFERFSLKSNAENFRYNVENFIAINNIDAEFISVVDTNTCGHFVCEFKCSCGNSFKTTIQRFMSGAKRRCEHCISSISSYEKLTQDFLDELDVPYKREYWFEDCRTKNNRVCYFDFYLPENNVVIECDGRQHFEEVKWNSNIDATENLITVKENDKIKDDYCEMHNIQMIRIPYYNFDKKEYKNIIKEKLQIH